MGAVSDGALARALAFAEAGELYRARRFAEAAEKFEELAVDDPVARYFAWHARNFMRAPPPDDWDGVTVLDKK